MKTRTLICAAFFAVLSHASFAQNTLTAEEKASGWRLLFDGRSTSGWRGFQKAAFPDHGWAIEEGCLKCLGQKGGDIMTTAKFNDFELTWEWSLSPKGNSGVKYFVDEQRRSFMDAKRPDVKGKVSLLAIAHEYQTIDDDNYPEKLVDNQKTGAWYGVLPPRQAKPRPIGEFNRSRLIVRGRHVEHWLNGERVLAYETDSTESAAGIAASKFKEVPGYVDKICTPILLQDHSTVVWFRNIKLRELSAQ